MHARPSPERPVSAQGGRGFVSQIDNFKNQSHASTGLWKLVAEVLSC